MSRDRWNRVREILEAALDQPTEQRAGFLDEACGSDRKLRREVENLLASDDEGDSFLENPPVMGMAPPLVGRTLSSYEILDEIGRGGMGEVYRARDTTLGREIAVKVLPEELSRDAERLSRFKAEARLLASLNHPNIVQIYSVEEENGLQFITMELIHGQTLAEGASKFKRVGEFVDFAITLTDAIASAHDKGITHRDLKPANIMITEEGRVKILDFGLAKASRVETPSGASELETRVQTVEGRIVGTFAYMSPEQAEGKRVDHRSDIFSIGVIFYELLSGKPPFGGDSAAAMLSSTLKDDPEPLSEVRPDLRRELTRLVHRCLVKDPERRYQSVKDVRNELEELKREIEAPGADTQAPEPPPRRERRAPLVTVALLSALIAGAAVWLALPRDQPPPVTRWTLSLPEGQRIAMAGSGRTPFDISPDGRYVAYVATDSDSDDPSRAQAFLRALDSFDASPIPSSSGALTVFFSADSQQLAFYSVDGGLWRTSVSGGTPVKIGDTVPLVNGVWGPDDTIVFDSLSVPKKLWRISAHGGEPEQLAETDGRNFHTAPHFLPDGRHLLATSAEQLDNTVEILSLDSGEHRDIFRRGFAANAQYLAIGQLLIIEGGSLLAAPMDPDRPEDVGQPVTVLEEVHGPSVSDTGTLVYLPAIPSGPRIVQIERVDGQITSWRIPGLWSSTSLRLSPDGERLAVTLAGASGMKRDVAVYDLARGTLTQLSRTGHNRAPMWSPDGRYLAFQSDRDGVEGIFMLSLEEPGDARPLLLREAGESRVFPSAWTPDGRGIVYRPFATGGGDLWVVPREGAEPEPLLTSPFDEGGLSFSPDGRFFAYSSNESGQYQIYVQEFPAGRKWPVTTDGGVFAEWVGGEIFYRAGDTMMVVQVETDPFRASAPQDLFDRPDVKWYDVTPDGQRFFLMEEPSEVRTELHVIQNWFQELERVVP